MDRQRISTIAHGDHPVAAPLSDASVRVLLDRGVPRGEGRVLDLGCGAATWLVRALTGRPGLRADGIDIDAEAIARAQDIVAESGLAERVTLHAGDAKTASFPHRFDLVICIGATHAFGGLLPTLASIGTHLAPGGTVLVGDGFWERAPGRDTQDVGFEADEFTDLAGTVDRIIDAGWTPVYGHVSTIAEWDDYEWSWTGTVARWALEHPADPDSGPALEVAADHRRDWLHGYRRTLGFVSVLLRQTSRR